jgi:plasmid maintenance system antidote protein VapI
MGTCGIWYGLRQKPNAPNGRSAISAEMALRIEGWLGVENGGRADVWIAHQAAYDLWKARKHSGQ